MHSLKLPAAMKQLEETIKLLKGAKLADVSRGTGFSYQWLRAVKNGTIKNPSINRIEKLSAYLKK